MNRTPGDEMSSYQQRFGGIKRLYGTTALGKTDRGHP